MKIILFVLVTVTLTILLACNKNEYQTNPQITVETINSLIPVGGIMQATLKFTQKDGKMGGGTFVAIRNRLNQDQLPGGTSSADTIVSGIPQFPDQNQGEFVFTLDYSYLHQSDTENDTILFKFAAIDRVGKSSDTISTGKIVVLYQ
ncbi:MAG: hypothetical protein ACHQET_12035 [Chitinophagales bacterium]